MDDLSPLLKQVMFRESWRGYDPDEVDAYVDQVGKAAAWAQGQIHTLQERAEAAETLSDEASDPQPEIPASDVSQTPEGLARTLTLAQSAADEAMAEARQQAEQVEAEAGSQAEAAVYGAQAEASQIRREADEYAESTLANVENLAKEREAAAATAEREKYVSEIAELTAQRALLAEDLELLERHVVEQRKEIERSLSKLTDLVTSPETFRTGATPSSKIAEPVLGGAVEVGMSDAMLDDLDESDDFDVDDDEDESSDADVLDAEIDDSVSSFDSGHGQPRFVTAADLEAQRSVGEPDAPNELTENSTATSQLFDEDELPQAVAKRQEEEPFLAQLREAASRDNVRMDSDDALSAFFNQEEDQRRSPWFLGGR